MVYKYKIGGFHNENVMRGGLSSSSLAGSASQ